MEGTCVVCASVSSVAPRPLNLSDNYVNRSFSYEKKGGEEKTAESLAANLARDSSHCSPLSATRSTMPERCSNGIANRIANARDPEERERGTVPVIPYGQRFCSYYPPCAISRAQLFKAIPRRLRHSASRKSYFCAALRHPHDRM